MRDVSQGRLLFTLSILTMIAYFWAVFVSDYSFTDPPKFLGRTVSQWSLIIPVLIFVYLFLFVVAWIGWTMATTPPALPLKEREESDSEKSGDIEDRIENRNV